MFQSRLQLHLNWWKGDDGWGKKIMQRWVSAVTVRSTIVVVLLLVGTLLLVDSYKWRKLSFPWYSNVAINVFKVQDQGITAPPPSLRGENKSEDTRMISTDDGDPKIPATLDAGTSINSGMESLWRTQNIDVPAEPPIATLPSPPPPAVSVVEQPPAPVDKKPSLPLTSLQKLEAGLRHARLAIRKALLSGTNYSHPDAGKTYEPYGDVYRNAATFRHATYSHKRMDGKGRSYWEMEKRFKIFAYREGEEPLVHNGPCKEIYAIEGRFIQELQGENPFLTTNAEQAHVFFLPFSVAMMVTFLYEPATGNMDSLQHFVQDYVDVVVQKYPFWNQSGGANHFMLSCHDWGPAVTKVNSDLSTNSIRVLCNANTSEGYVPWKDASLPEINLVGGNIPAELGGPPANERPHLAFFAGGDHGPVRPQLFRYWEGKDEDVKVYQSLPPPLNYHDLMKRSRFCICPGGYEVNSPRIVESIYNDCVPVIIADSFVLPFSDVLDWKSFSIHVKESDIPNLKQILQAVPMETYTNMQEKVKQVQRHFILHQPPQRYDVFHMILHSVWLRRLNIRIESS